MQNTTMKIIFNNRREKSITARVSNMAIPAGKSVLLGGARDDDYITTNQRVRSG